MFQFSAHTDFTLPAISLDQWSQMPLGPFTSSRSLMSFYVLLFKSDLMSTSAFPSPSSLSSSL